MVEKRFLIEKIVANYLYDGARFTTDELSKELRVSKRTLYEIFGNKNNLIRDCANYIMHLIQYDGLDAYSKDISDINFIKMILPIKNTNHYLIGLSKYNKFIADIKKLYPDIYAEIILDCNARLHKLMERYIEIGVERGLFRTEINASLFIDIIENERRTMDSVIRKYSGADILHTGIIAFFRGICSEKGVRLLDNILAKETTIMIKNIEYQISKKL